MSDKAQQRTGALRDRALRSPCWLTDNAKHAWRTSHAGKSRCDACGVVVTAEGRVVWPETRT